ncbi:MAG: ATPase domain-containing protein [Nanoarchaeota archaeon]
MPKEYYSIELQRDELNRYFGGGIPKNSLILIEGVDGSGKSVICQRFIYAMLKKGQKITYISTELNTLDFINQLESVNYGIREFMLNQQLLFITMVPFMGKVKFEEDFLDKIMSSKKLFESEVIVFDTLSFLLIKQHAPESRYFDVINFFRKLNNLNKTIIFTIDPTLLDEKFLALVRSTCDLYMSLSAPEGAGENVKIIELKRFKRPYDVYVSKIPFRVEPKEGLIIEIGSYA